jgi:hypothetical protein
MQYPALLNRELTDIAKKEAEAAACRCMSAASTYMGAGKDLLRIIRATPACKLADEKA